MRRRVLRCALARRCAASGAPPSHARGNLAGCVVVKGLLCVNCLRIRISGKKKARAHPHPRCFCPVSLSVLWSVSVEKRAKDGWTDGQMGMDARRAGFKVLCHVPIDYYN